MAKRYHQSKKAKHHESMGMSRYERHEESDMRARHHGESGHHMARPHSPSPSVVSEMRGREAYSGRDESRRMMARDGAMIREDMSAPALLPTHVIDQYWPRAHNYNMGYVDDLFYGAQKQMHEDYRDLGRELDPKKY